METGLFKPEKGTEYDIRNGGRLLGGLTSQISGLEKLIAEETESIEEVEENWKADGEVPYLGEVRLEGMLYYKKVCREKQDGLLDEMVFFQGCREVVKKKLAGYCGQVLEGATGGDYGDCLSLVDKMLEESTEKGMKWGTPKSAFVDDPAPYVKANLLTEREDVLSMAEDGTYSELSRGCGVVDKIKDRMDELPSGLGYHFKCLAAGGRLTFSEVFGPYLARRQSEKKKRETSPDWGSLPAPDPKTLERGTVVLDKVFDLANLEKDHFKYKFIKRVKEYVTGSTGYRLRKRLSGYSPVSGVCFFFG